MVGPEGPDIFSDPAVQAILDGDPVDNPPLDKFLDDFASRGNGQSDDDPDVFVEPDISIPHRPGSEQTDSEPEVYSVAIEVDKLRNGDSDISIIPGEYFLQSSTEGDNVFSQNIAIMAADVDLEDCDIVLLPSEIPLDDDSERDIVGIVVDESGGIVKKFALPSAGAEFCVPMETTFTDTVIVGLISGRIPLDSTTTDIEEGGFITVSDKFQKSNFLSRNRGGVADDSDEEETKCVFVPWIAAADTRIRYRQEKDEEHVDGSRPMVTIQERVDEGLIPFKELAVQASIVTDVSNMTVDERTWRLVEQQPVGYATGTYVESKKVTEGGIEVQISLEPSSSRIRRIVNVVSLSDCGVIFENVPSSDEEDPEIIEIEDQFTKATIFRSAVLGQSDFVGAVRDNETDIIYRIKGIGDEDVYEIEVIGDKPFSHLQPWDREVVRGIVKGEDPSELAIRQKRIDSIEACHQRRAEYIVKTMAEGVIEGEPDSEIIERGAAKLRAIGPEQAREGVVGIVLTSTELFPPPSVKGEQARPIALYGELQGTIFSPDRPISIRYDANLSKEGEPKGLFVIQAYGEDGQLRWKPLPAPMQALLRTNLYRDLTTEGDPPAFINIVDRESSRVIVLGEGVIAEVPNDPQSAIKLQTETQLTTAELTSFTKTADVLDMFASGELRPYFVHTEVDQYDGRVMHTMCLLTVKEAQALGFVKPGFTPDVSHPEKIERYGLVANRGFVHDHDASGVMYGVALYLAETRADVFRVFTGNVALNLDDSYKGEQVAAAMLATNLSIASIQQSAARSDVTKFVLTGHGKDAHGQPVVVVDVTLPGLQPGSIASQVFTVDMRIAEMTNKDTVFGGRKEEFLREEILQNALRNLGKPVHKRTDERRFIAKSVNALYAEAIRDREGQSAIDFENPPAHLDVVSHFTREDGEYIMDRISIAPGWSMELGEDGNWFMRVPGEEELIPIDEDSMALLNAVRKTPYGLLSLERQPGTDPDAKGGTDWQVLIGGALVALNKLREERQRKEEERLQRMDDILEALSGEVDLSQVDIQRQVELEGRVRSLIESRLKEYPQLEELILGGTFNEDTVLKLLHDETYPDVVRIVTRWLQMIKTNGELPMTGIDGAVLIRTGEKLGMSTEDFGSGDNTFLGIVRDTKTGNYTIAWHRNRATMVPGITIDGLDTRDKRVVSVSEESGIRVLEGDSYLPKKMDEIAELLVIADRLIGETLGKIYTDISGEIESARQSISDKTPVPNVSLTRERIEQIIEGLGEGYSYAEFERHVRNLIVNESRNQGKKISAESVSEEMLLRRVELLVRDGIAIDASTLSELSPRATFIRVARGLLAGSTASTYSRPEFKGRRNKSKRKAMEEIGRALPRIGDADELSIQIVSLAQEVGSPMHRILSATINNN